jgi:hypothetical protein
MSNQEDDVTGEVTFDFDLEQLAAEAVALRMDAIRAAEREIIADKIRRSFMPICLCGCGDTQTSQQGLVERIIALVEGKG